MADSKLGVILEARDKASGPIKQLDNTLSGLNKGLGGIVKGAGIAAAALGALRAASEAFDLGRAAAGSIRLAEAFDDLATSSGESSQRMLAAMRAASRGTISDTDLIASANRAMLLGVGKSADDMTKLLEVAGARAKAMGLTTAQAFSDIVTGIGRMSPLILDNLGITIDAARANEEYATKLGRTATSLSDAEKKQALLNAVVAQSAGLIADNATKGDDLASKFERMDAALANAKDALGALFAPAAAVVAENIARAAEAAVGMLQAPTLTENHAKALQDASAEVELYRLRVFMLERQLEEASDATRPAIVAQLDLAQSSLDAAEAYQRQVQEIISAHSEYTGAAQATRDLAAAHDEAAAAAQRQADAEAILKAQTALDAVIGSASRSARGAFLGAVGELGPGEALQAWQDLDRQLQAVASDMAMMGTPLDVIEFTLRDMTESGTAFLDTLRQTRPATRALSGEFDALKSKVAGVLSGALDVGVGVKASDLLPRQDEINEDARRLADVAVNGYASPWAAYLNSKFPGLFGEAFGKTDVKTLAAQKLRDFEDGMAPELIDKERAKERLRRLLTGEANMAQLAQEIASELSGEFGNISAGRIQALATQAVGVAATAQAPDVAGPLTAKIDGQFDSESVISRMWNNGAKLIEYVFKGFVERGADLPFADALLAIVYEQMNRAMEGGAP